MNEFGSLSALLDQLAPIVGVETPAWDDVLDRVKTLDGTAAKSQHGRMRRRTAFAFVFATFTVAVAGSALAAVGLDPVTKLLNEWNSPGSPGLLEGTYAATRSTLTPASLNGQWAITFHSDAVSVPGGLSGSYTISQNGAIKETGIYLLGGNQHSNLVLRDDGGSAACNDLRVGGFYQLKYDKSTLQLKGNADFCAHRRAILNAGPFARR